MEKQRKDVNIVLIQTLPINSCTFEQFNNIQEKVLLILRCKTTYCCRKDLPKYLYHVGNANELNSIIGNGLILGGKGLKRGRQAVFFTTEDENCMGETPRDSTKPRNATHKNTWKRLQNTICWCNLKLAQEKGLQFYQTRSHAVVLYDTLPAAFIEKAVCMKTQAELCQKVRLTPRLP